MTHIIFYEKPGCGGNARQRQTLEAAQHTLERRNLLTTVWTPEWLLPFLSPLPVVHWFNRAAPAVKSGEVEPDKLAPEQALPLLLAQPLLIRRPLMQRTDLPDSDPASRHVGFDPVAVHAWVGLGPDAAPPTSAPLEACTATGTHHCRTTT